MSLKNKCSLMGDPIKLCSISCSSNSVSLSSSSFHSFWHPAYHYFY